MVGEREEDHRKTQLTFNHSALESGSDHFFHILLAITSYMAKLTAKEAGKHREEHEYQSTLTVLVRTKHITT